MKYLKKKSFIISALVFFTACLISGGLVYLNIKKDKQNALAAPICGDNNIAGFAWSDNIGWVSFNKGDCSNGVVCRNITTKEINNYNCATTECTDNGGECADWCQVCSNNSKIICDNDSDCGAGSCVDNNYGVEIDWSTKNFSGYAWSSNIGWISFDQTGAPDYSFNANCLSTCDSSNSCTACYNSSNGNVYGWAKALSLGNNGLVGYWKFDEGSGNTTTDSSGFGNNCSLVNGIDLSGWRSGSNCMFGSCLDFDKIDDYVNCGHKGSLNNLGPMTWIAWIYPRSTGEQPGAGDDPKGRIIDKSYKRFFLEDDTSRNIGLGISGSSLTFRTTENNLFNLNQWSHIAVSWDGSGQYTNIHIYINGVEVSTYRLGSNGSNPSDDSNSDLIIGNRIDTLATFDGLIDEVKVYNRVLSQSEIQAVKDTQMQEESGWIKLSDDASWNNGVIINGTSKEFEGWAWNGNATAGTGIGWISFSHLNCDTDGDGIREAGEGSSGCPAVGTAIADYKVYITNSSPTAIDLKAPNITYEQACSSRDARRVQLTWEFSDPDVASCGDYQSAYQVIVDTQDHTSAELESMAVNTDSNLPLKTPELSGAALSLYPTNPGNNPDYTGVILGYNAYYYWWVKVWDKFGADSGWVQYNSPTDTDNEDGNNFTFWTYQHEFPEPYFYWFPLEPSEGENVSFWDGSYYYTPAEPNTNRQLCFRDGIEYCDDFQNFQWTPSNPATQISSPTASSTSIIFEPAKTSQYITLQTTDPTGYYCSTSTIFWAKVKLPTWKEVKYK